jgi:hypothetical protein
MDTLLPFPDAGKQEIPVVGDVAFVGAIPTVLVDVPGRQTPPL